MSFSLRDLSFRTHVSEEELQKLGLATDEEWSEPCFSRYNNRLYSIGGEPCAAVMLASEYEHPLASHPFAEVVAIEVLPRFRRCGLAVEIIRTFARDGRVYINSPSETLHRSLLRVAHILPGYDEGVVEVVFHSPEHDKLKEV